MKDYRENESGNKRYCNDRFNEQLRQDSIQFDFESILR